jgi:PAS domain S-box-containing protein
MDYRNSETVQRKDSMGVFALLLLAIFTTELAVMELFTPLFSRLGRVVGGLMDAGTIVALCAFPLWYFLRALPRGGSDDGGPPAIAARLVKSLAGLFLVEFLVMLELPELVASDLTPMACDLLDAGLTALLCAVPLWRMLFRPELRKGSVSLLGAPLYLYLLLLTTIFLANLQLDLLLPFRADIGGFTPEKIVDAFLTTLCCALPLWFLVVRPLKRTIGAEKARVATVFSQAIDAIVLIDQQGVISSFNPAAEKIFGYGAETMIGTSAALLLEGGRQELDELMLKTAAGGGDQSPALFSELSCRRRDRLTLVMNVSISKLLLEARPEYLLIMRDITRHKEMDEALRESETRFRQIFQQSEDAIIFFKPGACLVLDANANAEKIFGYSKRELQDGGFERIWSAGDFPVLERAIGGIEEGRGARHDFTCRRKDQEEIIVSLRGKRMLLQGIPVTYCTFRDVTERIRLEERTRDIQARLIQTNKMTSLGLLVSGVAHEINNPNNFIMANCEVLKKVAQDTMKVLQEYGEEHQGSGDICLGGIPLLELGDHTQRLIEGIAKGSRRVNDIVTNLKGFARQERQQEKHDIDVSQVAKSAVTLLQHELVKFTGNFHLELADGLPPVAGHHQQIGQVAINLLMNACQALPGKECGIWLGTGYDHETGHVTLTVRDEGSGIEPEDGQRILEPFFTTKLDSGGTGLGLSISDSIVREHGGTLEYTSHPGKGTTFVVRLPASRPAVKEQIS